MSLDTRWTCVLPLQHLITLMPIATPDFPLRTTPFHSQSMSMGGLVAWAKGWTCEQVLCVSSDSQELLVKL